MSSSSSTNPSSRFTFLATLLFLFFIFSAIILRSVILRRRFRRQIEEAIAAGVLLSSPGTTPSRTEPERPKLWDAFLAPSENVEWHNISPVAGRAFAMPCAPIPDHGTSGALEVASPSRSCSLFRRPSRRRYPTTHTAIAPSPSVDTTPFSSPETTQQDQLAQVRQVQVTLLITMPSLHRHADGAGQAEYAEGKERSLPGYWDEEEGVPDIVLGVTRVPFRHEEGLGFQ